MMRYRLYIIAAVCFFAVHGSKAGVGIFNSPAWQVNTLSPSTTFPVYVNTVQDQQYPYMISQLLTGNGNYPFINYSIKDYVSLQYTGAANMVYSNWTLTVNFQLLKWDSNGHQMAPQNGSLTINYTPGGPTESYRQDFESDGGDQTQLMVTGYTYTGSSPMPADIELTSRIEVNRYWKLDNQVVSNVPVITSSVNLTDNTARLSWSYLPGAESYDIEWLFVSGYVPSPTLDFTQATRVNTSQQTCKLNLAYDKGALYYRVRGVGTMGPNSTVRKDGQWSTVEAIQSLPDFDAHNWTYSAAYAEQDKAKEVVTFFDGSTRQRQAVTENNSQNVAMVAETMYDYEGRAAVKTLPAADATDDSRLGFYKDFNLDPSSTLTTPVLYDRKDFDVEQNNQCSAPMPTGLSTLQGAGNYYSNANPLLSMGLNAAIPDAGIAPYNGTGGATNGTYPFTQTLYGIDGKVSEEAGAGTVLSEGNNHTVKYFYATPLQSDIDKIFGFYESGDASHYQEKLTQDANGQLSVSYTNLSGKVVATSLVGVPAPGSALQPLVENNVSSQMYTSTLGPNTFNSPQDQMEMNGEYMCKTAGIANFTYNMTPGQISTCESSVVYPGVYDLTITVTDACNNLVPISGYTLTTTPTNNLNNSNYSPSFQLVGGNQIVVTAFSNSVSFNYSINFSNVGKYYIHKVLSIDPGGLSEYTRAYQDSFPGNCTSYTSLSQYNTSYANTISTQFCPQCTTASCLGPVSQYPTDPCTALYGVLKNDMSPGGQYFDNLHANDPPTQAPDTTWLSTYIATWTSLPGYTPASANVLPSGTFWYNLNYYISANASKCGNLTIQYQYHNWADVENYWIDCIGDYLVNYHPEYCRYRACRWLDTLDSPTYMTNSNQFDQTLAGISTYAEAAGNPYHYVPSTPPSLPSPNPVIGLSILDADPYFNDPISPGHSQYNTMLSDLNHYVPPGPPPSNTVSNILGCPGVDMWDIAGCMVAVQPAATITPPNPPAPPQAIDQQWLTFVAMYEEEKRSLINIWETAGAADHACITLCDNGVNSYGVPDGIATLSGSGCSTPQAAVGFYIRDPDNNSAISNSVAPSTLGNVETAANSNNVTPLSPPNANEYNTCGLFATGANNLNFSTSGLNTYSGQASVYVSICSDAGIINILCTPSLELPNGGQGLSDAQIYQQIVDAINACATNSYTAMLNNIPVPESPGSSTMIPPPSISIMYKNPSGTTINGRQICFKWSAGYNNAGFTQPLGSVTLETPSCQNTQEPNCLCTYIAQLHQQYNTTYPGGTSQSWESYVASLLDTAYSLTGSNTIYGSNVLDWASNCTASGVPVTSATDANVVPAALNCDPTPPCTEDAGSITSYYAQITYQQELSQQTTNFVGNYEAACFNTAYYSENMSVTAASTEFHYTLYYYDQAGNLVRTVPPAGVNILTPAQVTAIQNYRLGIAGGAQTTPTHTMVTAYKYNTLNAVVDEVTPDAGEKKLYYDAAGRLRFTQNAYQASITGSQQGNQGQYSYTNYDGQGRVIEVGESGEAYFSGLLGIPFWNGVNNETFPTGNNRWITRTYYDAVASVAPGNLQAQFDNGGQQNLRSRVATVTYTAAGGTAYDAATHYSYDEHGNVTNLVQDNEHLAFIGEQYKKTRYNFDLVSGNVNYAVYQPQQPDQFIHKYEYDADNRITNAYTSLDSVIWDQDAKYFYYLHGPLAREEMGQDKVHGCDYAYTLQGWLKGVNSNIATQGTDIGQDGVKTNSTNPYLPTQPGIHSNIAQDAYGFTINYFTGDYTAVNSYMNASGTSFYNNGQTTSATEDLFNGNIKQMDVALTDNTGTPMPLMDHHYTYDQLNRLVSDNPNIYTGQSLNYGGTKNPGLPLESDYSYDANGNILNLNRRQNNGALNQYDALQYNYTSGTNQLAYVREANNTLSSFPKGVSNYTYDLIGELTSDVSSNIATVNWSVYGKELSVIGVSGSTQPDIYFNYDAQGNRIEKIEEPRVGGNLTTPDQWIYTYYVRDASGNVMAIYNLNYTGATSGQANFSMAENPMYGSKRIGDYSRQIGGVAQTLQSVSYTGESVASNNFTVNLTGTGTPVAGIASTNIYTRTQGNKSYELTDHLGNVLMTITDRKIPVGTAGSAVSYYTANITNATDYYPFGATMPGRLFTSSTGNGYRYGYNGKEQDPETYGLDNEYDYGMRMYNPRLGRFMSVDPLTKKFPMLTPYQYASNSPIAAVDMDGLEAATATGGTAATPAPATTTQILDQDASVNTPSDQAAVPGQFVPSVVSQLPPLDLSTLQGSQQEMAATISKYLTVALQRQFADPNSALNTQGQVPAAQLFLNIGASKFVMGTNVPTTVDGITTSFNLNITQSSVFKASIDILQVPTPITPVGATAVDKTPIPGDQVTTTVTWGLVGGAKNTGAIWSQVDNRPSSPDGMTALQVVDGDNLFVYFGSRINHSLILRDRILTINQRSNVYSKGAGVNFSQTQTWGVGVRSDVKEAASDGNFTH